MKTWMLSLLCALLALPGAATAEVDLAPYLKKDKFGEITLSPSGDYLAATVPMEDRTALAILRREDSKVVGSFVLGKHTHVHSFAWVNDTRVVISMAEKYGLLDTPRLTGELYGMDADGGDASLLAGYRAKGSGPGTKIQTRKAEYLNALLNPALPTDDRNVLIDVLPMTGLEPFTRAERLDATTGRRILLARAPMRNARFTADNAGRIRFAHGPGADNVNKLYYRSADGGPWQLMNDEAVSHRIELPVGFSADDGTVYLQVEHPSGPDSIVAWDIATDQRQQVLRDAAADPHRILYRNGTRVPVGAMVITDRPRSLFFDEQSDDARQYRSLEAAFGAQVVHITSSTRDGRQVLVEVSSDTNPGDFFLYDTVARKAQHLISRRDWFDPAVAATVKPVSLKARDGLALHGYLTIPHGSDGRNLPMVVMPHGGPFGIFDMPSFESTTQVMARAGYAVLQVNFRGSGNYGRAFRSSGARQWGAAMQDDVTDATRWAIEQGHADAERVCIYGASYGAYAALMGAAREPGLYRCAAGYVGVYDLPMMFTAGDIRESGSGGAYLKQYLGDPAGLAQVSPVNLADRIKVPVLLAAGGEDRRAPVQHTRRMEAALRKAGVPVETLYYGTEGHGFYRPEHQTAYYGMLLAFLARSLGGQPAASAGASP